MPADTTALAATVCAYADEASAHTHPFYQLVLPVAGALELEASGRSNLVDALAGASIQPDAHHSFRGVGENSVLVLNLSDDSAGDELAHRFLESASRRVFFVLPPPIWPLLRAAAAQLAGAASSEARRRWAALVALTLAEQGQQIAARRPDRLARALAFIEARAAHPIQVADIARAAELSVSQLHALFVRWLGTTPQEVVATRRLDLAERLLVESELPIADIALRCGFADQTSLGRSLRRRRGITPGAVRRRVTSQPSDATGAAAGTARAYP